MFSRLQSSLIRRKFNVIPAMYFSTKLYFPRQFNQNLQFTVEM